MKKILLLSLAALSLLSACGKKDSGNATETEKPTTTAKITINGTDYATVKIGTKTWTAVNYNGPGGLNYNSSATNDVSYGKLYTLDEANAINLPTGWRLPTKDDYVDLLRNAGSTTTGSNSEIVIDANANKKLRSKTGWTYQNGDNSTGFNAVPAGDSFLFSSASGLQFDGKGNYTDFLTSTTAASTNNGGQMVQRQWVLESISEKESDNTIEDHAGVYNAAYVNLSRFSLRFVKDN